MSKVISGKSITLKNFNPNSRKAPFITSPRSVQACNEQGVDPMQLLRKNAKEIRALLIQNGRSTDDETVRQFGDHLEQRRKAKLDLLIKYREEIIQKERKSVSRQSKAKASQGVDAQTLSILEMEKRTLEKMKSKQKLDVRRALEFEIKQEMMNRKKLEKAAILQERKRQQEREQTLLRRQKFEKTLKLAKHREQQAEAERMAAEQQKMQMEKEEAERNALKEERRQKRLGVIAKKQAEKQRKKDLFEKQVADRLMQQQAEIQRQRELTQKKEAERARKIFDKAIERKMQQAKLTEKRNLQIKKCKDHYEMMTEQQRMDYLKRQQIAMQRKDSHDRRARQQKEEKAKKAFQKQCKIKKNLDRAQQQREAQNMAYQQSAEKKRIMQLKQEELMRQEMEKRRLRKQQKNERLSKVREQNDIDQHARLEGIKHELNKTQFKIAKRDQMIHAHLAKKRDRNFIKKLDNADNIQRIEKIKELRKRQIMEKLQRDDQKIQEMQAKKQKMMEMRSNLMRELDYQRQEIMATFEQQKATNTLDLRAYAKEFNIDIEQIQNELARGGKSQMGQSKMSTGSKKSKKPVKAKKKSPAKKTPAKTTDKPTV